MKVEYDLEADAAYIHLSDAPISRTEEESDVCILDWDSEGPMDVESKENSCDIARTRITCH